MVCSIIVSLTINLHVHIHQLRLIIIYDRRTREHAHKEFSKDECSAESCFIEDSSGYRFEASREYTLRSSHGLMLRGHQIDNVDFFIRMLSTHMGSNVRCVFSPVSTIWTVESR